MTLVERMGRKVWNNWIQQNRRWGYRVKFQIFCSHQISFKFFLSQGHSRKQSLPPDSSNEETLRKVLLREVWARWQEQIWLSENIYGCVFTVGQLVKNLPIMQETWIWSLGWEDPLEKGMATHSSILSWKISWQRILEATVHSVARVGHNWAHFHYVWVKPPELHPPTPRTQQIGRKECCLRPMRPGAMVRGCLPRGAGVTGAPATVSGSKQEGLRNETPPSLLPLFPLMLVLPTGWTQSESREREEGRDWSGVGVASRKMQGCTWSHHPGSFMTYKLPLSLGLSFVHHSSLLQSYRI